MKIPAQFTPRNIISHYSHDQVLNKEGSWIPARPYYGDDLCLIHRVKMAWLVFTGKRDTLDWEEEQ